MRRACTVLTAALCAVALMFAPPGAGAHAVYLTAAASTESPSPPPSTKPRVMVESCVVTGDGLVSGAVCELRITLKNMSDTYAANNILVTGRWSSEAPPPVDFEETNQAYAESIGPRQTGSVAFMLKTKPVNIMALDAVSLYLTIDFAYEGVLSNQNSVTLRIPVSDKQTDGYTPVEVEEPSAPAPSDGLLSVLDRLDKQLVFITGSALCLLAAAVLILLRLRKRA